MQVDSRARALCASGQVGHTHRCGGVGAMTVWVTLSVIHQRLAAATSNDGSRGALGGTSKRGPRDLYCL